MSLFPLTQFDFPNVSAYDSDLREVLAILRGVTHEMKDFTVINKITNAGAWDITKQYKPWTIVSDNNIGYISVRPVPAGIEITNTDYWVLVADYDILITNLSERISALESDNVSNKNRISALETDNLSNKNRISQLESPGLLVFGDSWTEDSTKWVDYVAAKCGRTAYNYAKSGYTYTQVTGSQGRFISEVTLAASEIANPLSISEAIVYGGLNDLHLGADLLQLRTAVIELIDSIRSNFQNARVIIVGINGNNIVADLDLISEYSLFIEVACRLNSIEYVNSNTWLMSVAGSFSSDNLHPSTDGYRIIRSYMQSIISGGQVIPITSIRIAPRNNCTITKSTAAHQGNTCSVTLQVELPQTWADDTWTEVAELIGVNNFSSKGDVAITAAYTGRGAVNTDICGICTGGQHMRLKTYAGYGAANRSVFINVTYPLI